MSLEYAILGLLSWKPFNGYELKKVFAESPIYYWSGNNNQIYRTLLSLFEDGLVTRTIEEQENLPPKKMYSLTAAGQQMLDNWLRLAPELPQRKHAFLLQVGWADRLPADELDLLLSKYQEEVSALLMLSRAQIKLPFYPARTTRENLLWQSIHSNLIGFYQFELDWVQGLRLNLAGLEKDLELGN